jgi:hypothetical protein
MGPSRLRGGLCEHLYLGLLVNGDLGKLTVIAFQSQGLLVTVRGFAPHLDTTDRASTLVHDYSLDLGQPSPMPDSDILGDPEA